MITIVTDSSAYFTRRAAEKLGVRVLPMSYTVAGQIFNEGFADENGNYRRYISANSDYCKTSQVNVGSFISTFQEITRKGDQVLCITISSRLSGTYRNAVHAAKEFEEGKICVVDSLSAAGGIQLLAEKARQLEKQGLSLAQIAERVEELRESIGIAFSVDSIKPLRKSGRISRVRQSVTTILNVRPILLCVNGTIISDGTARGKYAQINELLNRVPNTAEKTIIHFIDQSQTVRRFYSAACEHFKTAPALCELGPVLGIHIGTNVVGVAWIDQK